jgi:hypothetical protein
MAKRKAQETAQLQGHQQTAGQSNAWGSPQLSLRRPSVVAASRTLNPAFEEARLRPLDPPDVSQVSRFTVDLRPVV